MDQTHHTLRAIRNRVVVPHSIPGLVTDRVLVMNYLDGVPLTQLGKHVKNQSPAKQKAAFKRVRHSLHNLLCPCQVMCAGAMCCV